MYIIVSLPPFIFTHLSGSLGVTPVVSRNISCTTLSSHHIALRTYCTGHNTQLISKDLEASSLPLLLLLLSSSTPQLNLNSSTSLVTSTTFTTSLQLQQSGQRERAVVLYGQIQPANLFSLHVDCASQGQQQLADCYSQHRPRRG